MYMSADWYDAGESDEGEGEEDVLELVVAAGHAQVTDAVQ
jgi:hypothetical protein